MSREKKCVICLKWPSIDHGFCIRCRKSYAELLERDEEKWSAIVWAARRARAFEGRRSVLR